MYNHELTLISYEIDEDEVGNQIPRPIRRKVLCKVVDIGNNEFYNAKVSGLKPVIKFVIKSFEYEGEKEVKFDNDNYEIIRTYHIGKEDEGRRMNRLRFDEMELTCEKVIGHG